MLNNDLEDTLKKPTRPLALVVDDDKIQRVLIQTTLMQAGLDVVEAENGAVALALFQDLSPDIVLMDVKMPVMGGIETCIEIRKLSQGLDVPIVMITGLNDHDSITRAFDVDATDFITKPVNWQVLSHRIEYLLKSGNAFSALRRSESRLKNAQKIAALGDWEFDLATNEVQMSEQVFDMLGNTAQQDNSLGRPFLSIVHPDDVATLQQTSKNAVEAGQAYSADYRIVLPCGQHLYIHEQAHPNFSEKGEVMGLHGTVQDVTSSKKAQQKIHQLAYFDALTGLPNRASFNENAKISLELAHISNSKVALMYLDLNDYKRINDTLGHECGDQVLKFIAQDLATELANSEFSEIGRISLSRMGGDEFTIQINGFSDHQQLIQVAERVHGQLARPIAMFGQELVITGSLGIAVFPDDATDLDTLLKHADTAMYHAKTSKDNGFHFFGDEVDLAAKDKLNSEAQLTRLFDSNELVLNYQVQTDAISGKVTGLQALLGRLASNDQLNFAHSFVSIAQNSALTLSMAKWVLQTVCNQAVNWQRAGFEPTRVSVNISSRQFCHFALADIVKQALQQSQLSPHLLALEISEQSRVENLVSATSNIKKLKALGVGIVLDEFGKGFSSLSSLRDCPVDSLKIARSFVDNIVVNSADKALVNGIIMIAKSLNIKVIAKGVNSEEQLAVLQDQGCDEIQDHIVSQPLPPEQICEFLTPVPLKVE